MQMGPEEGVGDVQSRLKAESVRLDLAPKMSPQLRKSEQKYP
jgi:hypothetical protein